MQSRKSTLWIWKWNHHQSGMLMLDYARWWGASWSGGERGIRGSSLHGNNYRRKAPEPNAKQHLNWKTFVRREQQNYLSEPRKPASQPARKNYSGIIKTSCWAFPQTHTTWHTWHSLSNSGRAGWSPGEWMKLQAERGETFNSDRRQKKWWIWPRWGRGEDLQVEECFNRCTRLCFHCEVKLFPQSDFWVSSRVETRSTSE